MSSHQFLSLLIHFAGVFSSDQNATVPMVDRDHCSVNKAFICERRPGDKSPKTAKPEPDVDGHCPIGYFSAGKFCAQWRINTTQNVQFNLVYTR